MTFSHHELVVLFLSIALMLAAARVLGELFRRFSLPSVIGEIAAGIMLGPTVLGNIAPEVYRWFFTASPSVSTGIHAITQLALVFLLLVAGIEVDLSSAFRQGRTVVRLSVGNIIIPLATGAMLAWAFPSLFGGNGGFALVLFIGIALSITALPVVAKILMDLGLFQSDFGMLVLASAVVNDLAGWIMFSTLLQILHTGQASAAALLKTVALTIMMTALILTVLRFVINRTLPWIQANTQWPGGVISFIIVIGLAFAALTEAAGIHAIFGAFLAGIAIGDSPHLRRHTHEVIEEFATNIFTPLFFVSIGLMVDFLADFNALLTVLLLALAVLTKLAGSMIGGSLAGMRRRESISAGFAMSATGTMQIVLGLIAKEYGLINSETFAAFVIVAIATSILSGPMIKFFLRPSKPFTLLSVLESRLFEPDLSAGTPGEAIRELSRRAAKKLSIDAALITDPVLERESLMSTGIGSGIAVPHARIEEITAPCLVVGKSRDGIDFNAPDGAPARLVFMILTPAREQESQIQILAEISRLFKSRPLREECAGARSFNEFISALKLAYHRLENDRADA